MDRRRFVAALSGALAAARARAQSRADLPLLGVLTPHPLAPPDSPGALALRTRFNQLGWFDGKTIRILRPDAAGREDRLPELAADLVRKRVDVIWAIGPEAAVAAARATTTIPIVFWGVAAPIEQGLVDSLARPGRNATGIAFTAGGEMTKVLELLNELAPASKRVGILSTASAQQTVKGERYLGSRSVMLDAARRFGMETLIVDIGRVEDFEGAFAALMKWRAQAIFVPGTTLTFRERRRIIEFANPSRLASAFNQREFVEAGGLLSYGIDSIATVLQSFGHVDRLLRGARIADLPVELPSRYEFVVNARTARALGLNLPQSTLLRADRVIE